MPAEHEKGSCSVSVSGSTTQPCLRRVENRAITRARPTPPLSPHQTVTAPPFQLSPTMASLIKCAFPAYLTGSQAVNILINSFVSAPYFSPSPQQKCLRRDAFRKSGVSGALSQRGCPSGPTLHHVSPHAPMSSEGTSSGTEDAEASRRARMKPPGVESSEAFRF